jgi:putative polyhydroxyalkanoate system protein
MANIHIKRAHNLEQAEVRERIEKIASRLQDKLEAKMSWEGDTLNIKRSGATGSMEVGEKFIDCNVKLGMLLMPLKGAIESALNEAIDKALSE